MNEHTGRVRRITIYTKVFLCNVNEVGVTAFVHASVCLCMTEVLHR